MVGSQLRLISKLMYTNPVDAFESFKQSILYTSILNSVCSNIRIKDSFAGILGDETICNDAIEK